MRLVALFFFALAAPHSGTALTFSVVDPVLTPYYANNTLNLSVVPEMVRHAVSAGVDVALLGGSNGEWPSLSVAERLALLHAWASAVKGSPLRLTFHVGHTDVESAVALAAAAEAAGAAAILSIAPGMVFRPPVANAVNATVAALRVIAAAAPSTPFYYYHFPGLYNVDLAMVDFIPAAVAAIPTFRGVKYIDSVYEDILTAGAALGAGSGIDIFPQSGFLLPCLPTGCNGSPLFTWQAGLGRAVADAYAAGDAAGAAKAQLRLMACNDIVTSFGGTSAARAVYRHVYGIDLGAIRMPQVDLTPDQEATLISQLVAKGFIPSRAAAVHEADDDQHILFALSRDGGATFGAPSVVASGATAVWGPVLFNAGSTLWLFYSTSSKSGCVGGSIVARVSGDGGQSWGAPRVLLAEGDAQRITANPVVVTASGRWLLPYWDTHECEKGEGVRAGVYKNVTARVLMSDDAGATWAPSGGCLEDSGLGLIEGTLLVRPDGSVLQYFRTGEPVLYASASSDGGATWPNATRTAIPNPNAKVCLLSGVGAPLLAYNDDTSGRSPLTLAGAPPDASTWTKLVDIEPLSKKGDSFAYPTIVQKGSGEVLVSYSYNYHGIKVAHVAGLPRSLGCTSPADCAYNGICSGGVCACTPAWSGNADCSALSFVPGAVESGYREISAASNTSSWGGTAMYDAASKQYFFFGSELADRCGMHTWTTNSRIVRAVGPTAVGRFVPEAGNASAVVIPVWSHEVAPTRGPHGEWVLFASAELPSKRPLCTGCRDGSTPPKSCGAVGGGIEDTDPSYMTWAPTPAGPWSAPVLVGPKKVIMDANLAGVINSDGSFVGMWRDHTGGPKGSTPHPIHASDWKNPASYTWSEEVLFKDAPGPLEDMFIYKDSTGVFHALFHLQYGCGAHNSCGGHAFSVDGKAWQFTGTAYTSHTIYDDGSVTDFPYCERPHFVFAEDGTTPLALTNGVKPGWGEGGDQSFTLLRPLATTHADGRAYSGVSGVGSSSVGSGSVGSSVGYDSSSVGSSGNSTMRTPLNPLSFPILAGDVSTLARFKVASGSASWTPKHPDTLVAYLPPQPLGKVGDTLSVAFSWRSNGTDECAPATWGGDGCVANKCDSKSAYKSVHCVGGTGDFRVGLFDSAGVHAKGSGFCPVTSYDAMEQCLGGKPWIDYRGYHLRLFPHAGTGARSYPTAVPCGWYKMSTASKTPSKNFLFGDARIEEFGCFDLPTGGAPATLTLSFKRTGASEVTLTATLNGVTRTAKDTDASEQPSSIDTWAIQYPNDRPYKAVQFGPP